jgi:phospholipase C
VTSHDGGANHQYDLHDFFDALKAGNMPTVSFLEAIAAEDGHAGYSDPLLGQGFLIRTVNAVMLSPFGETLQSLSSPTTRTAGTTIR